MCDWILHKTSKKPYCTMKQRNKTIMQRIKTYYITKDELLWAGVQLFTGGWHFVVDVSTPKIKKASSVEMKVELWFACSPDTKELFFVVHIFWKPFSDNRRKTKKILGWWTSLTPSSTSAIPLPAFAFIFCPSRSLLCWEMECDKVVYRMNTLNIEYIKNGCTNKSD